MDAIIKFDDIRWRWHNGSPNDFGGSAIITDNKLIVTPVAGRDYWARTFYKPLLVKDDAQTFLTTIKHDREVTLATSFTLRPRAQFDQAGIMIRITSDVWVKAGIEYSDGKPRLSCVVTNEGYSDWSTQIWPHVNENGETSIKVRVSKMFPGSEQGHCIVFEASDFDKNEWTQVRIASLRNTGDQDWHMGLFAISPIESKGASVTFHDICLDSLVDPVHSTNPGL
eukprot:scaffold91955_cov73-Cyclotella_meneghiniana.AAC.2